MRPLPCRSLSAFGRLAAALAVLALPSREAAAQATASGGETVEQALCRLIDGAAARQHMPAGFLTRLLWQESSFRPTVVSPAGARGIAQFMPGTARERGLDDPFDPEQAIPASAAFLAELAQRFGNLGLAAAAYNGGPNRVAAWLGGHGGLPSETEDYVQRITGRSAGDWAEEARHKSSATHVGPSDKPCLEIARDIRLTTPRASTIASAALAPWGVQLSGNFSKSIALASFERARGRYASLLGGIQPMIVGTRLRTRGFHAFYRVRVPAQTRAEADALCRSIQAARGSCAVLRS
ncbi:lytic transglycosylase domain-containing protein [Lichenihabitans sp. Uapishka_5]|uniref:lytic transglycosylase domain-containing protein n=1 Tax=Lichenihabitans sp. Uapishka_5 TaxID=3037302 RepID=UPI0029E7E64E|nr:lytic transglycosylase domain-containing protein [Lichenihabitans sp. Uapishka_5]MDX7950199.1 lytic transglycosylase domain-containing protein [Lichenihabitans sp. Uapishka_5]